MATGSCRLHRATRSCSVGVLPGVDYASWPCSRSRACCARSSARDDDGAHSVSPSPSTPVARGMAAATSRPLSPRAMAFDARGLVGHFPVGQRQHGGTPWRARSRPRRRRRPPPGRLVHRRTASRRWLVDATGTNLVGPAGLKPALEHRKAKLQQLELVADRAIHDHAAKACLCRR